MASGDVIQALGEEGRALEKARAALPSGASEAADIEKAEGKIKDLITKVASVLEGGKPQEARRAIMALEALSAEALQGIQGVVQKTEGKGLGFRMVKANLSAAIEKHAILNKRLKELRAKVLGV